MGLLETLKTVFHPSHDDAVRYRCHCCGREFVYHADLPDPACPYCDGDSLDVIEKPDT